MRRALPLLFALLVGCGTAPARMPPDGGGAGDDLARQAPPDLGAPDLLPAAAVLRVHYPAGGMTLSVRGSDGPLNWSQGLAMTPGADDTWTFTSAAITAPIEWKPLLGDTTWSRGPNYHVKPGETVDVYPHFVNPNGQVVKLFDAFHSPSLPRDRPIWAYLPPAHLENARATFPVIYFHDGQNLFDRNLAFGGNEWMVDETLNGGAEDGTIREVIAVGIGNTADRIWELTPTDGGMGGGGADRYLAMIVQDLKPAIDKMLHTKTGREDTAIFGSSLGGLVSAHAGVTRAADFGRVGAMSPSTWWDNLYIVGEVEGAKILMPRPLEVYLDVGGAKDGEADTVKLAGAWRDIGYSDGKDLLYLEDPMGLHNEVYWAERLPNALKFLVGPRVPN
jgi:predicted alpha/beta superfamily hydrolase